MSRKLYGNLEIENNSTLRLTELASNGTSVVSIKAPISLSGDLALTLPGSDLTNGVLVSDGSGTLSLSLLVNANVSGSAAIAYSKLNLSNSIVNADIATGAAIAYSKLNLSNSIVNADVATGAAIDAAKIANGSVSSTEFQFLDGVTSSIQTQLDNKQPLDSDLTALASLATTGIIVRTGSGTVATRTLVAGTNISLTNANGVAGDITINATTTISSFKDTWLAADGATKVVTHSLASTDVMVQIFDIATGESIDVDSEVRTDANTLTLTASQAPGVSWRVLILAI